MIEKLAYRVDHVREASCQREGLQEGLQVVLLATGHGPEALQAVGLYLVELLVVALLVVGHLVDLDQEVLQAEALDQEEILEVGLEVEHILAAVRELEGILVAVRAVGHVGALLGEGRV